MTHLITDSTVSHVWRASLELFFTSGELQAYPGPGGELCYEVENVILEVKEPLLEPRIPDLYYFPDMQRLLLSLTDKKSGAVRTNYDRLHAWGASRLNQIAEVKKRLRANPHSRQAVVSIWNPQTDIKSDKPPCPVLLQFLVRSGKLNATCLIRSTDAWLGAVADMLAYISVQERLARDLKLEVGTYVHHSVSYHLYDYHYLQASRLLQIEGESSK